MQSTKEGTVKEEGVKNAFPTGLSRLFVSPPLCPLRMNSLFSVSPAECSIKLVRVDFMQLSQSVHCPQTHRLDMAVMCGSGDTWLAALGAVANGISLGRSLFLRR